MAGNTAVAGWNANDGRYSVERSYGPGNWKQLGRWARVESVSRAIAEAEAMRDPEHTRIARVRWFSFRNRDDEALVRAQGDTK